MMLLFLFLLVSSVVGQFENPVECNQLKSCKDCVENVSKVTSNGTVSCRWCRKDNRCYDNLNESNCTNQELHNNVTNWPVLCTIPLQHKYEYDQELSYKSLIASSAAYTRKTECINVVLPESKFTIMKQFKIECYKTTLYNDSCFAYVAVSQVDETVVVAFRGSKSIKQVGSQCLTFLFSKKPFIEDGKVLTYYKEAFQLLLEAGLENEIHQLRSRYPTYKFLVTGHSLGGALASLASLSMVYYGLVPSTQLFLYTFGMPRVGDLQYVRLHERYVVNSMRVVNPNDPITKLPLTPNWCHHDNKIIAAEKKDFTFFKPILEFDCDFYDVFNIKEHKIYMDIDVGNHCKTQYKEDQQNN